MKEFRHLGSYLREHRLALGFSQTHIAQALRINTSQFVSNWERGMCAPPSHSIPVLVKLLKLDRDELIEVMVKDSRIAIENKIYPKKHKKLHRA